MHYHFGTKDALLEAVLEIRVDRVGERIREGAREIAGARESATARTSSPCWRRPYPNLMDHQSDGISWVRLLSRIIPSDPNRILDRSSTQLIRNAASSIYPDASRDDIDRAITLCVGLFVPQLVSMKQARRRTR